MDNAITVKCSNGFTLRASGQTLVIAHKREEEAIPVSAIQSFSVKEPHGLSHGKIVFSTARSATAGVHVGWGLGLALGAEKTFFFSDDEKENAFALRDFVNRGGEAAASAASAGEGKVVVSVVEEIRGLKQLLDEGILTDAEFAAKKKQLLGI